jgi:hypothetical protein
MSETNITIPLDLPNVRVIGVEVSERGYVISVESTLEGTHCRKCGRNIQTFMGITSGLKYGMCPSWTERYTSGIGPNAIAVRTARADRRQPSK